MATGRRPYLDTTAVTLALAMNADPAPSAREINPLIPLELSEGEHGIGALGFGMRFFDHAGK